MAKISVADYVVVVLYLGATILFGVYIGRRLRTGKDYFLAGRRLPWWAIGMSLVATDIGATDIIGVGGAAYSFGLAVGNFEWIGCVPAMIVGAFVFIPMFWRCGIYTIPEFMERRYNVAVRSALAACWLIFMACNLGIMLVASSRMMTSMFGGNDAMWIILTAILVGVYTVAGGLAAVVYTDMIQCAVMIVGCMLVLILGIIDVGGFRQLADGIRQVEQSREDNLAAEVKDDNGEHQSEHTRLILPVDTRTPFPWTGIFFGLALVLSPAYWIGNQAIVQRSLGAKTELEAKASYVWGAVLKNLLPFIIAVPGLIALVKFPDLQNGDHAFPEIAAALLPTGLRGVFLAAFIAALMSSIDSYLNAGSAIATNDFYTRFLRPRASDHHVLTVGRFVTGGLVLWAVVFAFYLTQTSSGIYTIFQTLMAFFQGPALAILLLGLFWRGATGVAAFVGFVLGVLFSITLFALNQEAVYLRLGLRPLFQIQEPFLYFSVWAFLVTAAVVWLVSLLTPRDSNEKLQYVLGRNSRSPAT